MKRKIKLFAFILISVFLISFVSAVLDSTTQSNVNTNNGIELDYPKYEIIKNNQSFNLTIFNYNISDGKRLSGSNCSLQLFNHTGTKVYNLVNFSSFGNGYNHFIGNGNFTKNDIYTFNIYCENNNIAGFVEGIFEINNTGVSLTTEKSLLYALMFLLLFFLFIINIFGINKLPSDNARDGEGKVVAISYLKYLRIVLWMFEWMLLLSLFFLAGNLGEAYLGETLFSNFFIVLFRIGMLFSFPIVLIWVIVSITNVIKDKKIWNFINRGLKYE